MSEQFRSKAQMRRFAALEQSGQLTPGTTARWQANTPNVRALPERTQPKQPQRGTRAVRTRKPTGLGYS